MNIKTQHGFMLVIVLNLTLLSACNRATPAQAPLLAASDAPPVPMLDARKIGQGERLYNQHCASCHGQQGEGQPDWKTPNEDGSYPAPPHDNSGHTWHHSDGLLVDLIANGVEGFKQSQMPTFGEQLSDEEIRAIVEYMKTWWGTEERSFQWQMTWREQQGP
jgi:mono/diheme cytochrome c family protein